MLEQRNAVIADLPKSATPDYCELNVVSNSTGLLPARDTLSYPLCHIAELADIFIPVEDGGILERTGVVDVFNCLRRHDEASFGGGVFVVVRCTDDEVWALLAEKGHVVSRHRKYACIYTPYHLMGLESMMSIFSAVLHGRSSGSDTQIAAFNDDRLGAARLQGRRKAGHGRPSPHHRRHGGAAGAVHRGARHGAVLPGGEQAPRADVARGQAVTVDMLELDGSPLYGAWQETARTIQA